MSFRKFWQVLFLPVSMCIAQVVTMTGTVRDSVGNAIDSATVILGQADAGTITDSEGRFTLYIGSADVALPQRGTAGLDSRFTLHDEMLTFESAEKTTATIAVYAVNGQRIFSTVKKLEPGLCSVMLPRLAAGMYLIRTAWGEMERTFRYYSGGEKRISMVSVKHGIAAPEVSEASQPMEDALLVMHEGYRLFRLPVAVADTSGLEIVLYPLETGTVTDIDGNVYRTVKIGAQEWTIDNLRTTKYRDGTDIPFDTSSATWENAVTPKYCYYGNTTDADSIKMFGALYNWYVVDMANPKKIAPEGWHVPSDAEWDTLQSFLIANGYNWDGTVSDNKTAKSMAAETDWDTSSTKGTIGYDLARNNTSGFSALPGGQRNFNGAFCNIGTSGYWLGTTEIDDSNAYSRDLNYDWGHIYRDWGNKSCGFSVRLVRNR